MVVLDQPSKVSASGISLVNVTFAQSPTLTRNANGWAVGSL